MHDDDNPRRRLGVAEKDDRDQEAIMWLLIGEHPTQLTVAELVRIMVPPEAPSIESKEIERGVRELVGMGLLHCNGDTIRPTRAVLRLHYLFFERLTADD